MDLLTNGFWDSTVESTTYREAFDDERIDAVGSRPRDPETLRRIAWEISAARAAEAFVPAHAHVGLTVVTPYQGFAHWRILPAWVEHTAWQQGEAWRNCRLVLRLYDVSFLEFDGLNAHRIQDHDLPGLCGQYFFKLSRPGTWQLAEVGYLLKSGVFIPAARSQSVSFPPDSASSNGSQEALLVDATGRVEPIGNLWEQERVLHERRQPRMRTPLRLASFAFASLATGQQGSLATFVSELAAGQAAQGHETHVFVPAQGEFHAYRQVGGVHCHPLVVNLNGSPLEQAHAFSHAAEQRLRDFPAFDLIHLHEWMTGVGDWTNAQPTIRSLSSLEITRRNGSAPSDLSTAIEDAEREAVRSASCVLTPGWLRDQAVAELGLESSRVGAFPMEGRLANEWEMPLDFGQVKMGIGIGPLDRLIVYVGPLEPAAGVDLLLEALPVLLQRAPNLRLAYVGCGFMDGQLRNRTNQLGIAYAVRMLGHVEGPELSRLLRAAEALVLPSRYRVPFDDAVVDLARRAGRPVVTTHAGPGHLIRHEENGIVTYDNPGSMVWAVDRILGDPAHAQRMGRNGMKRIDATVQWSDVTRCYLELCAAQFPELRS
jgi:glycogen synthase